MSDSYFRYWGKAQPAAHSEAGAYHLLPFHSLDVAAVTWQLFDPETSGCISLADQLGVSPQWLQRWFSYCSALHDLGKFSSAFQGLVSGLSDHLITPDATKTYQNRHDSLGFLLWRKLLKDTLWDGPWAEQQHWKSPQLAYLALDPWFKIVTGHHGEPPLDCLTSVDKYYTDQDTCAVIEFITDVTSLLAPDFGPLTDKQVKKKLARLSWQFAGQMVLADWSGSDQTLFEYYDKPISLDEYWDRVALPTAVKAVGRMKPETVNTQPFESIQHLFTFIEQPTPLQLLASRVDVPAEPQMWILEDVTGAGKTEAALTLVSRLMSAALADGVYIGLPTMATANGMYDRMCDSYRALFTPDSQPSLVLAHGARQLSDVFVDSVRLSQHAHSDQSYDQDELSATAYCNSWVADSRKKALFSDVGVGTIDQALLAVLPARHQSLRMLGLRHKVLLIDEVHAYDAYMKKLLCALLEAHAAQGGSVIMLSATLPQAMRNDYLNAYRAGKGLPAYADDVQSDGYPLVTCCSEKVDEYPVESRKSVCRQLAVCQLSSKPEVAEQIKAAITAGRSVCWIRNTVGDAREARTLAINEGWAERDNIQLFHSRFAMCDRQHIETDVLARFGKHSTAEQRSGQLLIATQVIEQSLDLDFDLMITDLAPIDLLIQRAGRLHRHVRDAVGNPLTTLDGHDLRAKPTLCIYAPDAKEDVTEQWLIPDWRGTQAVYGHVGQLWLTLRALAEQDWTITMPDAARDLIEAVYSAEAQARMPKALEDLSLAAEGQEMAESGQANLNRLKLKNGYCRSSAGDGLWNSDTRTPTRLSADTINVALVKQVAGELVPWADVPVHPWALSQISLPEKDWHSAQQKISPSLQSQIDALKEQTPALRWVEVLPLVDELESSYSATGGWNLSKEEG